MCRMAGVEGKGGGDGDREEQGVRGRRHTLTFNEIATAIHLLRRRD